MMQVHENSSWKLRSKSGLDSVCRLRWSGLFQAPTKIEAVVAFENSEEELAPRARFELATLRLSRVT